MQVSEFQIGSFNLFNLVNAETQFHGRKRYSQEVFDKKIQWIGSQLDRLQGDIIGFQEIFHLEAFSEALEASEWMKGADYVAAGITGNLPRVGIATKYRILESQVFEDFPSPLVMEGVDMPIKKFSRPVLKCLIEVHQDLRVSVYVVHLKSKRPDLSNGEERANPVHLANGQVRSLVRRAMEARALRELLMKELRDRNHPVIVLGDVNDTGMSVTTRVVSGEPPHRRFPNKVKREIWDTLLYHVKDIQARQSYHDYYFSHIHNGHHEALDHIMVSQELVRENPKHIGSIGYVRMYNDHLVDETLTDERVPLWQSDHGQVVASIELRK
ncbi:MAG: endonuclease/exonuclease/phosphatase family protein [Bacteroidota bacterium]